MPFVLKGDPCPFRYPGFQIFDSPFQFGPNPDSEFCGGSRSGSSFVGRQIDEGMIGFMTYSRNHRNLTQGYGPNNIFIVESNQIRERTSSPGNNDQIRSGDFTIRHKGIKTLNCPNYLGRTIITLHGNRPDNNLTGEPCIQPVENIPDDRACW